jgi:hypothetical protein
MPGGNGLILDIVPKFNDPDAEYVTLPPPAPFLLPPLVLIVILEFLSLSPLSVSANITTLMPSRAPNKLSGASCSSTSGSSLLNISGKSLVTSVTLPSNLELVQFF